MIVAAPISVKRTIAMAELEDTSTVRNALCSPETVADDSFPPPDVEDPDCCNINVGVVSGMST
jgi:hypothetical protein